MGRRWVLVGWGPLRGRATTQILATLVVRTAIGNMNLWSTPDGFWFHSLPHLRAMKIHPSYGVDRSIAAFLTHGHHGIQPASTIICENLWQKYMNWLFMGKRSHKSIQILIPKGPPWRNGWIVDQFLCHISPFKPPWKAKHEWVKITVEQPIISVNFTMW
jgi:hypothetical protein